ncbi:unnamed protein product [Rhodiola kirilowii]
MASPLFEIDDQTDEDFFDKLIEDEEVEFTKSGAEPLSGNASVESQDVAEKKISVVSQTGVDSGLKLNVGTECSGNDGSVVEVSKIEAFSVDPAEENRNFSDNKSDPGSEVRYSDVNTLRDIPIDNAVGESNSLEKTGDSETVNSANQDSVSPSTGIREVDWSVFSSESRVESSTAFGSYSDFFSGMEAAGGDPFANLDSSSSDAYVNSVEGIGENSVSGSVLVERHGVENYGIDAGLNTYGQNYLSSQYSENLYPGWRFDPDTGLWHQLENFDANVNSNDNLSSHNASDVTSISDSQAGNRQVSSYDHLQGSFQSASGISEEVNSSVYDLNHVSRSDVTYPENMVFDHQYPGWYYDTIVEEWRTLESYTVSVNQSVILDTNQQDQLTYTAPGGEFPVNNNASYGEVSYIQDNGYGSQISSPDQVLATTNAAKQYDARNTKMWQHEPVAKEESSASTVRNQNIQGYVLEGYSENISRQYIVHGSEGHYENMVPQPTVPLSNGWSSDGRPYHPLVTFGFGGKLILMKSDDHFGAVDAYGSQNTAGLLIEVLSLTDIVMNETKNPSTGMDTTDYFAALCQQSFTGPLVGGSVGMKDVNKWVDERIMNYDNSYFREGKSMMTLYALLKVACQHYGKLRSPFGSDYPLPEKESPELAVANLFASLKTNRQTIHRLIQNWPSEGQVQATAYEVEHLLVSGRKKEALECAKQGQLWGPALVLAAQLGDQFYNETMKEMALQQFVAGSPLRTLYLLIAGKPNDAFSNINPNIPVPGILNGMQPCLQVQFGSNPLLDDWVENLSVIVANRTKDDELAIIHLGDCLWKERSEAIGAHVCYLVADANFESYSDAARLCLIGADHIRNPRTYAHPEAIQRTELYEYSKVLGNSQFTLFPFQPYKLIYAHMLAEVGKLSESLRYCQAILKTLKSGRGQEEDLFKQLVLSLEERTRAHQQGGYGTDLAPAKIVGKLLNVWSNARGTAGPPTNSTYQPKNVVTPFIHVPHFNGGLPPLVPSPSSDKFHNKDAVTHFIPYRVSNSQSTLSMSTLVPPASSESTGEPADGANNLVMPNRSISEPEIGKTPKDEPKPQEAQLKPAVSANPSRFGRFGSQIFQKTVGLVLRPRSGKQAKLGEKNKFYYDEKLKRWVEEGAEKPVEEVALPPPPTTGSFQNKIPDHRENLQAANEPTETIKDQTPGMIPPVPTGSLQFSSQGRIGVRSRYVDTFNKAGGSSSNMFKPPSISTVKSGVSPNPKFFVPPATVPVDNTVPGTAAGEQETDAPTHLLSTAINEDNVLMTPESGQGTGSEYVTPSTSSHGSSFLSPHPPLTSVSAALVSMQRFPSMDNNIYRRGEFGTNNDTCKPDARRTASWSGSLNDANISDSPNRQPLGATPDMNYTTPTIAPLNQHNSSDNLQEVDF